MSSKAERKKAADQRRAERDRRREASMERQRAMNKQVYGDGALGQRAEEQLGTIYDLSTRDYKEDENKQGTSERIENDGIDKIGEDGGLPAGYEETAIIFNQDGELFNADILLKLGSAI